MKLLSVSLLLFVAANALFLVAENASAAPIAIRRPPTAPSSLPVLGARSGRKISKTPKKSGSSSSKSKKLPEQSPGPPGPADHLNPRPIALGTPSRPDGPKALVVDQHSRWLNANKKAKAFLVPSDKADGGRKLLGEVEKAGPGKQRTLYAEDDKGTPAGDGDSPNSGYRIDNQGNPGKEQIFNGQAQSNGDKSTTFGSCIGHSGCGANAQDIIAGLQLSAQEQAPIHLVS